MSCLAPITAFVGNQRAIRSLHCNAPILYRENQVVSRKTRVQFSGRMNGTAA